MNTFRCSTPRRAATRRGVIATVATIAAGASALAGCGSPHRDAAVKPTPRPTPTATPIGGPPAVAPWSHVRSRETSEAPGQVAGLSFAPGSGGLVQWGGDHHGFTAYAAVGAGNAIGAPHALPDRWTFASAPQWTVGGKGTVLLTRLDAHHEISEVGIAPITTQAHLGTINVLARGTIATAALEGDTSGNLVIAWTTVDRRLSGDDFGYEPYALRARAELRAAGTGTATFVAPTTLLDEQNLTGGGLQVAMGEGGHAVVAMTVGPAGQTQRAGARVVAWSGTPSSGLGARQVLGVRRSDTRLAATGTSSGLVVVAWGTQAAGQEADSPWVVRAAALGPGELAFSPTQVVDPGGAVESTLGDVFLAPGVHGTASLAWTSIRHERGPWPIVVATTDATGTFGRPRTALGRTAGINGFAVDPTTGASLVTVPSGDESAKGTSSASPGAAYGALEPIAEGIAAEEGPEGSPPAFDQHGVPAVAFTHEERDGSTRLWIQSRQP